MKITVFCSSSPGVDPSCAEAAAALGRWIGENGHSLIYGGGDAGFMGVTAKAVKEAGGHVTGVLPGDVPFICRRPQTWCDEIVVAKDLGERKKVMTERADAFVALPGGPGTLDEITEVMDLIRLGKLRQPAVLFDFRGYYRPLKEMLEKMKERGFLEDGPLDGLLFTDDLEEIGRFLGEGDRRNG